MAADGNIDYGRYTTAQLREALSSIDRSRFPLNFGALQRELSTRELSTRVADHRPQVPAPAPKPRRKRPVGVWIIVVFYAFFIPVGTASLIAATTGAIKLPSHIAKYYASFGAWDYVRVAIPIALGAAMAVALFRMRRVAFHFAASAYLYGLVVYIWRYDELKTMGQGLLQTAVGFAIGALLVYYLWRLLRKGALT